jgi:uncharacterized protein
MPQLPGVTVDEARLADVCARYGIARLLVFGSVARGTAPPTATSMCSTSSSGQSNDYSSVAYWCQAEQLADELAALFGRPVELVSPGALHRRLKDTVLSEARTLYAA